MPSQLSSNWHAFKCLHDPTSSCLYIHNYACSNCSSLCSVSHVTSTSCVTHHDSRVTTSTTSPELTPPSPRPHSAFSHAQYISLVVYQGYLFITECMYNNRHCHSKSLGVILICVHIWFSNRNCYYIDKFVFSCYSRYNLCYRIIMLLRCGIASVRLCVLISDVIWTLQVRQMWDLYLHYFVLDT